MSSQPDSEQEPSVALTCPHCQGPVTVEIDHDELVLIECDEYRCGAVWHQDGSQRQAPRRYCDASNGAQVCALMAGHPNLSGLTAGGHIFVDSKDRDPLPWQLVVERA